MLHANSVLGSQADAAVLVDQPEAFITQKARVKRNRRTEWEYYVQFPGFPEHEGEWYSARDIKTQHPRGADLIREFEHAGEEPEVMPQQPVPLTQDAGPSQIGSFAHSLLGSSQQQHLYTQEQAPSQMRHHAAAAPNHSANQPALTAGFQSVQSNQHQLTLQQPPYTGPPTQAPLPLHWSFERLQQAQNQMLQPTLHPSMPGRNQHMHQHMHQPSTDQYMQQLPLTGHREIQCLPPPAQQQQSAGYNAMHQPLSHEQLQANQPASSIHEHQQLFPGAYLPQVPAATTAGNSYPPHMQALQVAPPPPQWSLQAPVAQPVTKPLGAAQHTPSSQHLHPQPPSATAAQQHPSAPVAAAPVAAAQLRPNMHPASQAMAASPAQQVHRVAAAAAAASMHQHPAPPAASRMLNLAGSLSNEAGQMVHGHQRKAVQPLQSLTNDLTSRILSQQANQWRKTQSKKGTALLDLVPSAGQQLQSKATRVINSSKPAEPSKAQSQALRAEQHCEAFVPAVQTCIESSGLELCRPFHQQAVTRVNQQGVPPHTATAQVVDLHSPQKETRARQAASDAQPAGKTARHGAAAASQDLLRQAEGAVQDDLFLGPEERGRDEVETAQRHIAEDLWANATIGGARRVQDSLELHVKWNDGFDTWLSLEALKKRQYCRTDIIDFLVSKVRKKSKG